MEWRQKMREPMRTSSIFRGVFLVLVLVGGLVVAGEVGRVPRVYAAEVAADKEYIAVFERGSNDQAFAVLEKPKGAPLGAGTTLEIDAFGLRVSAIDTPQAEAFLHRLPELEWGKSQDLPPGFKVYADSRYVAPSYASGSQKYKIVFTDPADYVGMGRSNSGAGGGPGGGPGGGGSGSM
jgi:hypothetical protein